jgi:hypothetical protein
MICGHFTLSRPSHSSVLELLPPILLLKPTVDDDWLETILQRMVSESALCACWWCLRSSIGREHERRR